MMPLPRLAWWSAWNRRSTLALVVLSIALASVLLFGFERVRTDLRTSFTQSVSGTDLIIGPRTSAIQLLLYSVFRLGDATNNMRMSSVQALAKHPAVEWIVPLSLGDSHRGFPVLATHVDYFERFKYADRQALRFSSGRAFAPGLAGLYEAVLGAEVAEALGYQTGARVVISHGSGAIAGNDHDDKPFTVTGILARTGTPVDRTLHISLESMEAIHVDWIAGAPMPGRRVDAEQARTMDLVPRQVTAALVGLNPRTAVFSVQRQVAEYREEALMAILPGVALDTLWQVVGVGEQALLALSSLVALVSLAGLVAVILAGLNERRRELAVLRAVGAGPRHIFLLLAIEGALVTLAGVTLGALITAGAIALAAPWVQSQYGVMLTLAAPSAREWGLFGMIIMAGWLASLIPGLRAYTLALADGLSPRT